MLSTKNFAQNSLWETKVINQGLTLNLPAKFQHGKSSFIQAFGGEVNANYYALQYYDTTFFPIDNEEDFQISLTGFMSGRVGDSTLKRYDVLMVDTTIGGAKGLFATFTTNDTSEVYKHIYYFVTLANNQFYWFHVYSSTLNQTNSEMDFFFKSIKFDSAKLKERLFRLTPVHIIKKAE
jgi:hypothetical protein